MRDKFYLLLVAALLAPPVFAIYPEDGMYWSPEDSGRGYYLEVQGDTAWVIVYAYEQDSGQAEIYGAVSEIRDDGEDIGLEIRFHPPPNPEGYFPLHWMVADLVKVEDGPCITCINSDDLTTYEKVGKLYAWFPYTGVVWLSVHMDADGAVLDTVVERMNYARARMANEDNDLLFHDLRGEWVFVDVSNPDRSPWRFVFDERVPDSSIVEAPYSGVFRDSHRDAEFRCTYVAADQRETLNGCELHYDGEVIFSATIQDIGAKRIQAFRGGLPEIISGPPVGQPEYHRGPETVIGLRVERPRPQSDE